MKGKIKELEDLLAGWVASEQKHHGEGLPYLAGIHQGSIDALTEAIEILKEPSNTQIHTDVCKFENSCQGYGDGVCALSQCSKFERR